MHLCEFASYNVGIFTSDCIFHLRLTIQGDPSVNQDYCFFATRFPNLFDSFVCVYITTHMHVCIYKYLCVNVCTLTYACIGLIRID